MSNHDLFHKFFDDAAIFPPGLAPLGEAVDEHLRRGKDEEIAEFIGPLALPVGKILEASELAGANSISYSAILDVQQVHDLEEVIENLDSSSPAARIASVEVKVPHDAVNTVEELARGPEILNQVDTFVELPYAEISEESLSMLASNGFYLKFRTGGIRQDLFPSSEELIRVIFLAVEQGLRFKLTAGLHRAMRYTSAETGFDHFGFANVGAAVAAIREGASIDESQRLLDSDERDEVAKAISQSGSWRENFVSFGTCSVREPAETLVEMNLLDPDLLKRF